MTYLILCYLTSPHLITSFYFFLPSLIFLILFYPTSLYFPHFILPSLPLSYLTSPHLILLYFIISYFTLSYSFYFISPHLTPSYLILFYFISPHITLSCLILSGLILSCLTSPYLCLLHLALFTLPYLSSTHSTSSDLTLLTSRRRTFPGRKITSETSQGSIRSRSVSLPQLTLSSPERRK